MRNKSLIPTATPKVLVVFVLLVCAIVLCPSRSFAQEGTRAEEGSIKGKVMLIPFEPLMYMSQVDKKINEKTKWTFDQIRENFRKQVDAQLMLKLKQQKNQVVSFYIDSAKMAKDLAYIYQSRTLAYELIDPKKREEAKKEKEKKAKTITNGQLTVDINNEARFMNAKITDLEVLGYMNKKYAVEYFIFINELDIIYDMESYDINTDSYKRKVSIHYTIMDKSQKVISSGIASISLSSEENDPSKIVSKAISPVLDQILAKFVESTKTKEDTGAKKTQQENATTPKKTKTTIEN